MHRLQRQRHPETLKRVIVLCILLIASIWVALVNGEPLFHPDTSTYVRGPDFAVVYFFGNKYASSWTQQRTFQRTLDIKTNGEHDKVAQPTKLNSPFDKAILGGRSIYYGAMLYLGHLTSDLWLPVFVQGAIFVYLTYILIVICSRLSIYTLLWIDLATLAVTPASFDMSYLMPDIFASFVILATIIITFFWTTLKHRDRVAVSAIMLFSIFSHTTHLALLFCLAAVLFFFTLAFKNQNQLARLVNRRAAVLFLFFLCGVLGELAFIYGARLLIGAYPIRPPFLMARLIADGPGLQFLKEDCAKNNYTVCHYVSRLPMPAPAFLWNQDLKKGVFSVADLATRRALSSEQTRFALDVALFDPIGVIAGAVKNTIYEFMNVGIDTFFLDHRHLQKLRGALPQPYFDRESHSRLEFNEQFYDRIEALSKVWYSSIYVVSIFGLLLMLMFWRLVEDRASAGTSLQTARRQLRAITSSEIQTTKFAAGADISRASASWERAKRQILATSLSRPITEQLIYSTLTAMMAIFFNAAICGTLSAPIVRYQTRVSWIPLFFMLLLAAKLYEEWRSAIEPSTSP
jgi:hypothetical protein